MSGLVSWVAKVLGVVVIAMTMYFAFFGTSDFFVFGDGTGGTGDLGNFDGMLSMVISATEVPMAEYYRDNTYKAHEIYFSSIESSVNMYSLDTYTVN